VVVDADWGQGDIKVCGACKDLDDMYSQEGACMPVVVSASDPT
jgi:hypothetical protein